MKTSLARSIQADIRGDLAIPSRFRLAGLKRPSWLLRDSSQHRWVVADTGAKPNRTIRFDVRLPGGVSLSKYQNLIETIECITFGVRTGPLMSIESGQAQASVASSLIVLARWMIANQIYRFEDLTAQDIEEYVQLTPFGIHTILNSEAVLNQHLDGLIAKAGFQDTDTEEARRVKAAAAFPTLEERTVGTKHLILGRIKLLVDAGLDGVGLNGQDSKIASIFDPIAKLCGYYLSPSVRRRMRKGPMLDELDDQVVTQQHIFRQLMAFRYLYLHRRFLDDALHFEPFPNSSPSALAQKLGKEAGRTATVPVQQAVALIERSVRWILDYAPLILDVKEWADQKFDENPATVEELLERELDTRTWPLGGPCSPFPLLPGQRMYQAEETSDSTPQTVHLRNGMTLATAITFLATACAVVIAAFSARRAAEILGLETGCLERDETQKPWINVFIHKTTREDSLVPVPEVVASAINVLERLSLRARVCTGTPFLFQYNLPISDTCVGLNGDRKPIFRLATHLRRFGYFIDVPAMSDGTRWTFRPHQFRRFFAVLYIWIYELGDWGALAYHLRHFDPDMTRRYVSDPELGHIIAVASKERTAIILAGAALGRTTLAGIDGGRLKLVAARLYGRMIENVEVVSERKFIQRLQRFIERTGLSLHAFPWGYCASFGKFSNGPCDCSSSRGTQPDLARASVSTCNGCEHNVATSAAASYLNGQLRFHQAMADSPDKPELFRRASREFCKDVAQYLASIHSSAPSMVLGGQPT